MCQPLPANLLQDTIGGGRDAGGGEWGWGEVDCERETLPRNKK